MHLFRGQLASLAIMNVSCKDGSNMIRKCDCAKMTFFNPGSCFLHVILLKIYIYI